MVNKECSDGLNMQFFFENRLPDKPRPHSTYYIKPKNSNTPKVYITDVRGIAYEIVSSGGTISLTSPNGTISINGTQIDVSQSVLDSIISLHNDFPDLQGGTWHFTQEQHQRVLNLIYENSVSTVTVNPTTGERGLNTSVNLTYNTDTNDDVFTSASINQGIGNVLPNINTGNQTVTVPNLFNNTTFTLSLGYTRDGNPLTETKSATYTTYLPQWSGISTLTNLNESNYSTISAALQKTVQADDTISRSLQPVGHYIWFVSTNANATITNNGFNTIIGNWDSTTAFFIKQTVTLTLANGSTTGSLTFYRTRQTANLSTAQNFTIS